MQTAIGIRFYQQTRPVLKIKTLADFDPSESAEIAEETADHIVDATETIIPKSYSFPHLEKVYHPSIFRAYKESDTITVKDPVFNEAKELVHKVLLSLNRQAARVSLARNKLYDIPARLESNGFADKNYVNLFSRSDDRRAKALIAFIVLNQPRGLNIWLALDRYLCVNHATQNIDMKLLGAYALNGSPNHTARFPKMLLQQFLDGQIRINELPFTEGSGVFDSTASALVRDNQAVERLSLLLNLFAAQSAALKSAQRAKPSEIMDEIADYSLKVLTAVQNPVKLGTLRHVWEAFAKIQTLPNTFELYRKLHQQISFSITTDPLQLAQSEECIASLLDNMVTSKFKSSVLLDRIFGIMKKQGMNCDAHGLALFNSLIQLQSYPFAIHVLQSILDHTTIKMDFLFRQWRGALLSADAKDYINGWLLKAQRPNAIQYDASGAIVPSYRQVTETQRSSADWILSLFSFGRELTTSSYGKTLHKVEASFIPQLTKMTPNQLISIIHAYGLVGRYQPDVVVQFDEAVQQYIDAWRSSKTSASTARKGAVILTLYQVETILWSYARLNHRSALIPSLIEMYLSAFQSTSLRAGSATMARFLWSLAVLEHLDISTYNILRNGIFDGFTYLKGEDARNTTLTQLVQIRSEFLCQLVTMSNAPVTTAPASTSTATTAATTTPASRDEAPPTTTPTSAAATTETTAASTEVAAATATTTTTSTTVLTPQEREQQLYAAVDEIAAFVGRHSGKSANGFLGTMPVFSSFSHLDASKTLFKLGITHENEKLLPNGYLVDVYIPSYKPNYEKEFKDVVLEFDGPTHYDSYLQNPLGPTLMKKRHLTKFGYHVVNMSYAIYSVAANADEKCRIVREFLEKSLN